MLYLIHGADEARGRAKLHAILESLFQKRPDAEYFRVTPETWNTYDLHELASSQGLFQQKHIVVLDKLFDIDDVEDVLLESLEELHKAPHVFIFFEGALSKKIFSAFEKYAEKVYVFEKEKKAVPEFNMFSLTDALGERNRKKLWTLYQKAKLNDVSDEDIHRILSWQIKSMLLAKHSKSADEVGMKAYPFNKSLSFLKKYPGQDAEEFSRKLLGISHDAHRGIHEMDIALERFILNI